jgi:peptide/nickel transport system permease protein
VGVALGACMTRPREVVEEEAVVELAVQVTGSYAHVLSIARHAEERGFTAVAVSGPGIMFKHLLPNIMPTILVLTALDIGSTILGPASLAFLGIGIGSEVVTWGSMLSDGRNYIASAWWVALFPGLAIFTVVLAVNLVGDWLRDRYDPRSPFRTAKLDAATRAAAAAQLTEGTPSDG